MDERERGLQQSQSKAPSRRKFMLPRQEWWRWTSNGLRSCVAGDILVCHRRHEFSFMEGFI